ncbi:hypothetical protein LMH87_003008 [Akanthomyces muscarius]|uniref:Uncharacterized protein n=1 Tax=Akanthomyces muscarius TaxID=2231603 RepID=A0A9W8Q801_AKAMU|nr:hypothetical protein LMH87_003008 [Akanthomyces muscarius]KAJ4148543.1 hypothetical protein LMH87_003008 [Akanthomyces muscarius]
MKATVAVAALAGVVAASPRFIPSGPAPGPKNVTTAIDTAAVETSSVPTEIFHLLTPMVPLPLPPKTSLDITTAFTIVARGVDKHALTSKAPNTTTATSTHKKTTSHGTPSTTTSSHKKTTSHDIPGTTTTRTHKKTTSTTGTTHTSTVAPRGVDTHTVTSKTPSTTTSSHKKTASHGATTSSTTLHKTTKPATSKTTTATVLAELVPTGGVTPPLARRGDFFCWPIKCLPLDRENGPKDRENGPKRKFPLA